MARTFEFVLHFVGCVTVTVSPNQIIIIMYVNYDTHVFTLEISSLGFIGDFNDFRNYSKLPKLPKSIRTMVIKSVLNDSYNIYRMRNSEVQ